MVSRLRCHTVATPPVTWAGHNYDSCGSIVLSSRFKLQCGVQVVGSEPNPAWAE